MLSNVVLYKNTGLCSGNCIESYDKLVSLIITNKITVDAIATKQEKDLVGIRVNLPYDELKECDYCTIGRICYYIDNISMFNDNVCNLSLTIDYLSTVGVSNFIITEGWCVRRHVNDDTLFANTIEEDFTPTERLHVDLGKIINHHEGTSHKTGNYNLVVSTIDLSNPYAFANSEFWSFLPEWVTNIKEASGMYIPKIPYLPKYTLFKSEMYRGEALPKVFGCTLPYSSVFWIDNSSDTGEIDLSKYPKLVLEHLSDAYSLGLDNVVTNSYTLPADYVDNFELGLLRTYTVRSFNPETGMIEENTVTNEQDTSFVTELKCKLSSIISDLTPTISGDYKNNKVFSGQFNKIYLTSMTSGEIQEFEVEDIFQMSGDKPILLWVTSADLRPEGKPFCFPNMYRGSVNVDYIGLVNGSQWLSNSIFTIGKSGYLTSRLDQTFNSVVNIAQNFSGTGSPEQLPNNILNIAGLNTLSPSYRLNSSNPNLHFQPNQTLQSYIGNTFFDYRMRLSDNDMKRFDNYLTQFGYAVSEPLTDEVFFGRKYFNYVKAINPQIRIRYNATDGTNVGGQNFVNGIISSLVNGVRVWHELPSVIGSSNDNPIVGGE